jgi:hypothetical protein
MTILTAVLLQILLAVLSPASDPFRPSGRGGVLIFVLSDCPISNGYAPEIQRICTAYGGAGFGCTLIYEDAAIDDAAVQAHLREYGYTSMPAVIDSNHRLAARGNATVTPQALVVEPNGTIRYRGRIDDFYAALGKPRQTVTSHDLREALDALLAGRAVPHPDTTPVGCIIERH